MVIQDVKKKNKLSKYSIGIISDEKSSDEIMSLRVFQAGFQNYSGLVFVTGQSPRCRDNNAEGIVFRKRFNSLESFQWKPS